jgi:L-2-hydroxyglutarate oxidase
MSADRIAVVGGGIVGLAVARQLLSTRPGIGITVFEKEPEIAQHQTGHNSGVVHAGLYYEPGSLKVELCRRGRAMLLEYCAEKEIIYRTLGKVVVATEFAEVPRLRAIFDKAVANQVPGVRLIGPDELAEIEPSIRGVAAIHSPTSAVTDFVAVARALADDVRLTGGEIRLSTAVNRLDNLTDGVRVETAAGAETYTSVVACAGLGTDRIGSGGRLTAEIRTVPFRGEYFRLVGSARDHVRGLVYPVPDPRYPFLGVHLTRRWNDEVLVGPSAVLALALEGYRWSDINLHDLLEIGEFPGFWRMARQHWRTGTREIVMSLSKRVFARQASRYLPELRSNQLVNYPAGVRAQALRRDGTLVDDFVIDQSDQLTIVRNAPSPAATSSLAIAEHIVGLLP